LNQFQTNDRTKVLNMSSQQGIEQIEKRWDQMIKYYRDYAQVCSNMAEVYAEVQNEEMFQHKLKESCEFKGFADFFEENRDEINLDEKLKSIKLFDEIEK
jgi:hypothetical protein